MRACVCGGGSGAEQRAGSTCQRQPTHVRVAAPPPCLFESRTPSVMGLVCPDPCCGCRRPGVLEHAAGQGAQAAVAAAGLSSHNTHEGGSAGRVQPWLDAIIPGWGVAPLQLLLGGFTRPNCPPTMIPTAAHLRVPDPSLAYVQDALGPSAEDPRLQLSPELGAAVTRQWLTTTRTAPRARRASGFARDVTRVLAHQLQLPVKAEVRTQDGLFSIDLALTWQDRCGGGKGTGEEQGAGRQRGMSCTLPPSLAGAGGSMLTLSPALSMHGLWHAGKWQSRWMDLTTSPATRRTPC